MAILKVITDHVEIELPGPDGIPADFGVKINGEDVSKITRAVSVKASVDHVPVVHIYGYDVNEDGDFYCTEDGKEAVTTELKIMNAQVSVNGQAVMEYIEKAKKVNL